jgi:hypothetical protein
VSLVNEQEGSENIFDANISPSFKIPGFYPEVQTSYRFIDTEVAYGETYTYEVEPIFSFMTLETDRATHQIANFAFTGFDNEESGFRRELSTNRFSQVFWVGQGTIKTLKAIDKVPPPCPTSLKFNLYMNNGMPELRIKWQHSVSSQMDIKYYQIFKRESILSPYVLIGMLHFNDAVNPMPRRRN